MRAIRRMKASRLLPALALLGLLGWNGCSEVREQAALPSGPAAKVHGEGWADLSTGQFLHGEEVVKNQGGSTTFCQRCHGEDLQGKGDAKLSCFQCHSDPAKGVIHPAGWADLGTGQFLHAASVRQNGGSTATCQGCHGANYDGGIAQVSCLQCHSDPAQGQIHPADWLNPTAKENFHGEALRLRNFDMSGCQSCHGADYAGGVVETSCLTCHSATPEGCTTCHGGNGSLAPPKDTRGNRETTFFGVGAHQAHLGQGSLSAALNCTDCHQFPAGFADPAHIDGDGRAELVFGARASTNGSVPVYDPQTNTCAGTYCHSGGRMGNNAVPVWTEVGSGQAACGTCHSLPPGEETGHAQVALSCSICHSSVVDADNNIIDTSLHINGQTDF